MTKFNDCKLETNNLIEFYLSTFFFVLYLSIFLTAYSTQSCKEPEVCSRRLVAQRRGHSGQGFNLSQRTIPHHKKIDMQPIFGLGERNLAQGKYANSTHRAGAAY